MGWIVIIAIVFVIILIIAGVNNNNLVQEFQRKYPNLKTDSREELLLFNKNKNIPLQVFNDIKNIMFIGKDGFSYISGHTQIDSSIKEVFLNNEGNKFTIYEKPEYDQYKYKGEILKNEIEDIILEDSTTIEKKITAGRILLTGFFALAWKKKQINGLAFVTIIQKQGKFTNEIVLQFEGNEAVKKANTLRNYLINEVKDIAQ